MGRSGYSNLALMAALTETYLVNEEDSCPFSAHLSQL